MAAVMTETTTQRGGVPAEVDAALVLWGRWRPRSRGPAGYPRQSSHVRVTAPSTRPEDEPPGVVDNIERIVIGMPGELAAVLCMQYRDCLDEKGNEFSYDKKAMLCGLGVSTYRNRLESARWYVTAKLT